MADIRKRGRVWQARVRRKGHPTFTSTHDTRAQAEACARAGIDDLHFHDLRHEATSRLFETCQFNIVEISMITGHKDLAMLRRYTHLSARSLAERLG